MEDEERLDRPWNAWIAVRKESLQLVNKDSASQSPTSPRRMSYQQWLSEKELAHLRKIFANAQEEAKTNEKQAKLLKGKTFDEWLEDKRREMEKEKEKDKGMEENQKQEEDKKQQRRRMSQRIIQTIMKASIQVMMSVISMTHFLDPDTASFPSKHALGWIS